MSRERVTENKGEGIVRSTFWLAGVMWLLSVGAVSGVGFADTVDVPAVKDNTLYSTSTNSNGAGTGIFCGRTGNNGGPTTMRSVMAFDVAGAVPAGSTVTSATLTLTLVAWSPSNMSPQTHTLHRLLADWGEGTSMGDSGTGAPATVGDATWVHTYFATEFWAAAGGDFGAVASASATVISQATSFTWGTTSRMVDDVQCWLDEPGCNDGWLLMGNEIDLHTAKRFASREWFDPGERPLLTIEFTPPAMCPADVDDDGEVGINDFLLVLGSWGPCEGCPEDIDGDGDVGINDFLIVLGSWGPCP